MNGSQLHRITFDPQQFAGKPCIRGLRVRVQDVLELLANGLSVQQVLAELPYLEKDDVLACLEYAARHVAHPRLVIPT